MILPESLSLEANIFLLPSLLFLSESSTAENIKYNPEGKPRNMKAGLKPNEGDKAWLFFRCFQFQAEE